MTPDPGLRERLESAARVILTYVRDDVARKAYGRRSRAALIAASHEGIAVKSYRVEWATKIAGKIEAALKDASQEFNGRYAWDTILVDDQIDVLEIVAQRMRRAAS